MIYTINYYENYLEIIKLRLKMFIKKILLTLFMLSLNFYSQANNSQNNETTELLKQQIEQNSIIIKLLSETLQLEKERKKSEEQNHLLAKQLKNSQIQAAQEEAEKGFSFTECGIVIRDTFFEEFSLRSFSLEFSELLIKNLKKTVMRKALSTTLGIPDVLLGDLPARQGYNNAALYPMIFLENSLQEYKKLSKHKIEALDPRVQALKEKDAQALAKANTTTTLLDAQSRSQQIDRRIAEEDPQFAEQSTKANMMRTLKYHQDNEKLADQYDKLSNQNSHPGPNPNVEVVNDPDSTSSSFVPQNS
jgi:hypothetical protein